MKHFLLKLFFQVSAKVWGPKQPILVQEATKRMNKRNCDTASVLAPRDSDSVYYLVQVSEKTWQET